MIYQLLFNKAGNRDLTIKFCNARKQKWTYNTMLFVAMVGMSISAYSTKKLVMREKWNCSNDSEF